MAVEYYILKKEEVDYEHHGKHEQIIWRNINTGAQYVDFLDGELLLLNGLKIGKLKHWAANEKELEIVRRVFELKDVEARDLYILYNITIDPVYRRRGHGMVFYRMFEEEKKKEGYRYIVAWRVKRIEAINFFKKMGFDLRKVPKSIHPDLHNLGLKKILED
ncbi:MAG: GNAT family N-acetyltransferase [Methanocellales archaeon]